MEIKYKLRLFIGRIERCPQCNRRMWNRGENLHTDLYNEERNVTYCSKCYPRG